MRMPLCATGLQGTVRVLMLHIHSGPFCLLPIWFELEERSHVLPSYPAYLHINRGNHEAKSMNCKYHFQEEVLAKYDRSLYSEIQDLFNHLPLCSGTPYSLHLTLYALWRAPALPPESPYVLA